MPLNQLKVYNSLLDIAALNTHQRTHSLKLIFTRDIVNNNAFSFRFKPINPTPKDGELPLETLFSHLTTEVVDKQTRKREFEYHRSIRLHWIKFHLEEMKPNNTLVFSVSEPDGNRTYIYDKDEKYVVVLEPLRQKAEYYLLTAFHVRGKDSERDKYLKKYKRRLPELL
jgi:hypothetical protein